jgi:Fur family ferric uptake transcriptional regulator
MDSTTIDQVFHRCQSLGMRLSRQRRYILELLWDSGDHLSAREIYDRLNQMGKPIGHTSVYQNLEALAANGIVECIERADGRLYGHTSTPHSHVHCLDTQKIRDIEVELPAQLLADIEAQTGIKISHYRVDFFGHSVS